MKTKKQHYIPQFFLKMFSEKNDSLVSVYLKPQDKFILTNTKRICYRDYYYDPDNIEKFNIWLVEYARKLKIELNTELLAKDQYIESVYLNTLEITTANFLKKILESSNGILLQDDMFRVCFLIFIINLHARSPYYRVKYEYLFNQRNEAYARFPKEIQNQLKNRLKVTAKEQQIIEILDLHFYFEDIIARSKYEWSLAILDRESFFIGDNFTQLYDLKELCIPISLDRAILIRPKDPNQRKWYLERSNKKYITKL
ncbi:DUF4238 domain-containing protein [Vaginisenegalia massiliensis]|uniref:DUF4238 domain-containing protein n=1 Tax=Vaginisenegalia massiliensis TaxID=2058294 RepID=UPI000F51F8DC|nr:DUF4238 domain-containing protein [Vaginisenegalia massiliensis]